MWTVENSHEIVIRGHQYIWAGFLRDTISELLENVSLEDRLSIWFQHDAAPAQFRSIVGYMNI